MLKTHLMLNTLVKKLKSNPIKRFYVTKSASFEHKVNMILKNNKEEFIKKLNKNNEVEKQLAQLNIASWMSCIQMYGKNAKEHVPSILDLAIENYILNIHRWPKELVSKRESEIRFICTLVDELYSSSSK